LGAARQNAYPDVHFIGLEIIFMLVARKLCILALLIALALLSMRPAGAMDIVALGSWSEIIDSSDLIGGAGGTLTSTYESALNQIELSILNTADMNDSWRVDIRRLDITWPASLTLYAQRTSDGTGLGSISGGASYQVIGTTDAAFFSGTGDRDTITLQLKLTDMSIQITPDTYSTTVVYTLVDT
jgi:hypothetical protein